MKKKKFKPLRVVFYLLLILYSVITLGPFLWSVVTSLKPSNEVMNMNIPGQVVMVPTYMLLSKLGWVNTYKGMTIPFLTSLFGIFLMRQFYFSIPKSVEEAAELDGLSRFGIFFRIIIPMSKTALSTQFILMFTGNWNSFFWPSLLATSSDMYTLPVGLNSFYGQYFQLWDQVLAGVMILSLPAIVIFLIFQKNFVKGIATSGMKE